jgi:CheY-like chemotaxis protein
VAQVFGTSLQPDAGTENECTHVLTFVKHLVEMMGGAIPADYQAGVGTTCHFDVRVTLPQPSDNIQYDPKRGLIDGRDMRPLKILVAEDAPDNLLLIRAFLGDKPWVIDSAENGRIAVEKAANTCYDLILMDIDMPELDGHDATRQIRVSECRNELAPVPIIALTAHNEAEGAFKSLEAGCSAHLTKPICKAALVEAIWEHARTVRQNLHADCEFLPEQRLAQRQDIL